MHKITRREFKMASDQENLLLLHMTANIKAQKSFSFIFIKANKTIQTFIYLIHIVIQNCPVYYHAIKLSTSISTILLKIQYLL